MAIEKEVKLYNDVLTTYHRISQLRLDYLSPNASMVVSSYAGRVHRAIAPDAPYIKEQIPFTWVSENPLEDAYNALKKTDKYEGADDV